MNEPTNQPKSLGEAIPDGSSLMLHIRIFRLMKRLLHQGGGTPDEVEEVMGTPAGHVRVFRQLSERLCGKPLTLQGADKEHLMLLLTGLQQLVKQGEIDTPPSTANYPDGWRAAL